MSTDPKTIDHSSSDDSRMSRQEVALRLGVSIRSVQRLDGQELHPIFDEKAGRIWYDRDEVEKVAAERGVFGEKRCTGSDQSTRGQVAAEVYSALQKGKTAVQIVIEHKLHPDELKPLYRTWLSLQDRVIASADWVRFRQMIKPLNSVEDLVKTVEMLVGVYCAVRDTVGPVQSAKQVRGKLQGLVEAQEELWRFSVSTGTT